MKHALVFPGQGSQFVGMGKDVYDRYDDAKAVFDEVDDALGEPLSKIAFDGPAEKLTLTENTQPALMATSMAILRVLEKQGGVNLPETFSFLAGHSLGEYTALCAAGSFSLADTARLLRIRGQAMQRAVPVGEGAMAALIGVEFDKAEQIAKDVTDGGICEAANDNGGGQVVISGSTSAIEKAINVASDYGVKKAVKLPVSAPFHSSLMSSAAAEMKDALENVTVSQPSVPVVANVTAKEVLDPSEIKSLLVAQVTGTVRWRETVLYIKNKGVSNITEIGAGKVLSGLAKRIDRSFETVNVQNVDDIERFLNNKA